MQSYHASRISRIATDWTMLNIAHQSTASQNQYALRSMLERYASAVHRYLLAAVKNEYDADDLMQEFGLRFLEGKLRRADPQKGRFRDFLKTSLRNLVVDHQRRQLRRSVPLLYDPTVPADDVNFTEQSGADFDREWRMQILANSWQTLRLECDGADRPYYSALKLRSDNSKLDSQRLARLLSVQLAKPISALSFRKILSRARRRMAELIIDQVRASLLEPSRETIEEELIALDLLHYCQPVMRELEN